MSLSPAAAEARALGVALSLPAPQRAALVDLDSPPLSAAGALLLLFLMPLVIVRLLLLVCVLSLWLLLLLLLTTNRPAAAADPDRPRFRCYPLVSGSTFAVGRLAMAALGFHVQVSGRQHVQAAYSTRRATAVVCNHVSYIDVFVVGAAVGPYYAVARSYVATWPIFGQVLRAFGYAAVERRERSAKASTEAPAAPDSLTRQLADRAKRTGAWQSHPPLLVFPEGTTSSGNAVLRFKTGAFVAGEPVLPVAIKFKAGPLCGGWAWRPRPTHARWCRGMSTEMIHLCRLLSRPLNRVEVTVLPPFSPSQAERADPALYAQHAREQIAGALGVSTEDCGSIEDAKAFYVAVAEAETSSRRRR
jgi:lysophosphatidylcholine acyltransferase/lyso-PAF acetyltransferase